MFPIGKITSFLFDGFLLLGNIGIRIPMHLVRTLLETGMQQWRNQERCFGRMNCGYRNKKLLYLICNIFCTSDTVLKIRKLYQ